MLNPLTMWITTVENSLKTWEYQTTLPVSWETCMQVKKQQLELDMKQQTGSKLGKEYQGCILSPCLFKLYAEYVMWNERLDEAQAGIKILERNINNFRYANDTTLMAEIEEELKSLLRKVKEESKKAGLKLNIQKTKIMPSSPNTSWQIDRATMETVTGFIFLGSKITADGDCSHEIKWQKLVPWKKSYDQPRQHIKKQRHTLPTKVQIIKAMVFPGVMYGCQSWRRLLRVSWTARRSNQSILKKISPEYSLEELMLKLQYFGHLMWRTDSLERPWCWERLKAGEREDRGWDGWMASLTQWTWVWAGSGSLWWTRKPSMLQSMGSQKSWTWLSDWKVAEKWEEDKQWLERHKGPWRAGLLTLNGHGPHLWVGAVQLSQRRGFEELLPRHGHLLGGSWPTFSGLWRHTSIHHGRFCNILGRFRGCHLWGKKRQKLTFPWAQKGGQWTKRSLQVPALGTALSWKAFLCHVDSTETTRSNTWAYNTCVFDINCHTQIKETFPWITIYSLYV